MNTASSEKTQIPAVEGLLTWPSEDPRIIASKCKSCGSIRFPKGFICHNPHCKEKEVEEVHLSKHGTLYSYAIQHYPPPPPYHPPDPFVPYGIGWVELPEGIRIAGMMTQCDVKDLRIGLNVEMVIEKIYDDEQGNEVITWKWKPTQGGN